MCPHKYHQERLLCLEIRKRKCHEMSSFWNKYSSHISALGHAKAVPLQQPGPLLSYKQEGR